MAVSAILMGVSVALAAFQSKPDASSRVVVTFPYQKSSVTTVQQLPGAQLSGPAAPTASSTSTPDRASTAGGSAEGVGEDSQPAMTIPAAPPMETPSDATTDPGANQTIYAAGIGEPVPSEPAPAETVVVPEPSTPVTTVEPTPTETAVPTQSPTETANPSPTAVPTQTAVPTHTAVPTGTVTPTSTAKPTTTVVPTATTTVTPSATAMATQTATSTATSRPTATHTRTVTPTRTPTASPSMTHSTCTSPTRTPTVRPAPTAASSARTTPVWPTYRPSVWSPRPGR